MESAIGHGRCTRRFANDPRVQRRSRRTAIPRAPRKNPVAATLGNVTRKGASRDGASGRPRPDRGPTAAITTRRVREWFNVTTPLGNRRVPGVRARSRRPVRRRTRRRRCAEKPPLPVYTRAKGSGRSRASARAATGGVAQRARAMFRGVFTNLERDVVDLWGEGGVPVSGWFDGAGACDAKTLESEDDFPAVSRPARGLERVRTSTSSYVHLPKSLISATSAMVIAFHVCCAWVRGRRERRSSRDEQGGVLRGKRETRSQRRKK